MHRTLALTAVLALAPPLAHAAKPAPVATPPLIPLKVLLGAPDKVQPQLSPDGKQLAWRAPDEKGVIQVWVRTIGKTDDKQVTHEPKRPIPGYFWTLDGKSVIYAQDQDGDENFHQYQVDLASGNVRDLTPFRGVRADVVATSRDVKDRILVSMNLRSREVFDVYSVDLKTGAIEMTTENPGDVLGWVADRNLQVLGAQAQTEDGDTEIRVRAAEGAPFHTLVKVDDEENVEALGFTPDDTGLYLLTSVGEDTMRFVERNLATGTEKTLASSPEADISDVMMNPITRRAEAAFYAPDRMRTIVIDPAVKPDLDAIAKLGEGDCHLGDRDLADDAWLAACVSDHGPVRYYAYDRATKKGTFLFSHRKDLESLTAALAPMKPVTITARDGMKLHAFLTLPVGVAPKKLPAVLFVHGGPWANDSWGFHPYAQWLANRGYAVLQVNYRGSTNYGKKYLHAGDKQWGLAMHDDLIDGVRWLVNQGYADEKRIAIYGGSYGGYAALEGVTATPTTFACAVDICGPSSIKTLFASIPPYWKPFMATFRKRVGDPDDPKDAELLKNASPLFKADKIVRPLLIGQGANDPRVKKAEAEQIVAAIEKNGGSVTYVLYSDEGHGFHRQENNLDFSARAEAFLGKYLGGRVEPMTGEKVEGSTAVVKVVGPQASAK